MVLLVGAAGCTAEQRQQWEQFDLLHRDAAPAAEGDAAVEPLGRVSDNPADADGEPAWHPQAVAVRVYPTTRFALSEGQVVLEARIELVDAMGDPVKASGLFAVALEGSDPVGLTPQDRTLYRWQISVRTLDDQKRHYDPVTQTYLFNLKLREMAAPREAVVAKASFTTLDGKVLQGQMTVEGRP